MRDIKEILKEDNNYPKLLKEISDAPSRLYYRGKIMAEEPCFAIVGTRNPSPYGKQLALEIAGKLSEFGLTIVSGLAPGIDTFSHLAVVEKNKRTIAILGTGLDENSIYPKENIGLARKIVDSGGLLLSEYKPGTWGNKFNFPKRNRLISGISLGVLVPEAKERSGSLITANFAFAQNKKVFAAPGSLHSSNSKGPHILIKQGAKLIETADDIIKELGLAELNEKKDSKKIKAETFQEQLVLYALSDESLYIDKIIETTKLKPSEVLSILTLLEIKGQVKNLGGNVYCLQK